MQRQLFHGMRSFFVAALMIVPVACQSEGASIKKAVAVDDGFFQVFSKLSIPLDIPLQPLRPAGKQNRTQPTPIGRYSGTLRRFSNEQLNSRSSTDLLTGPLMIAWRSEIPPSFPPTAILESNGSVVLETDGLWLLFDRDGKRTAQGPTGESGIVLDAEAFYAADATGMIVARKLLDGTPNFAISLLFGNEFARSFILRESRRLIVVSRERELDPHKAESKEQSLAELVDLGERLEIDRDKILRSAKAIKHLAKKTNILLAASTGEKLILATRDRIYTTDLGLKFTQALSGEFVPLGMSLDDSGRIYMVIERSSRHILWTISPDGEIVSEFELPSEFARSSGPPVIGIDNTAFLSSGGEILSIDQSGKLKWRVKLPSNVEGMVVTPNRTLVVAAGSEVLAFDSEGKKRIVFDFREERVVTSPTIMEDGSVLVASRSHIFKLSASPSR